jgi:hypothetical protein
MFVDGQPFKLLLNSSDDLKAISVRLKRVALLQEIYVETVPRDLAGRSRVADERADAVVVMADTSAVAAKLRQLAPRIVAEIVKREPERTGIRLDVQLSPANRLPAASGRALPESALEGLASLRDALPESELRAALQKMVARHRR